MLGIEEIGYYIPADRISNYRRKEKFGINDHFIEEKIGVRQVAIKAPDEETSDLCIKAFQALHTKTNLNRDEIEALIVVTQNPDQNIPHVSAKVHDALKLPEQCACFDISLGCSGFVYALSVLHSFMEANKMKKGLLLTADPYSKIIDPDDKNTSLLFGDAGTATLISDKPRLTLGAFTFGTLGSEHKNLICENGVLFMNGRAVFNFAAKTVPENIHLMARKNKVEINNIDRFLFHQGSKIIVDTITKKLGVPKNKVPYLIHDYGNTVSSTIPILVADELEKENKRIAICGFGVGLSWASGLLKRV